MEQAGAAALSDCGIVYVASRNDRYVEEAFLSAHTVKLRLPLLPITLFTDRPRHPLCTAGNFDRVEPIVGVSGFSSGWAAGQLNRLHCLPRTPYARTLHLDTDTRVLTDELPWLFAQLDDADVGLVETATDDSYSRRHFGRRMYSAGFILYRRNAGTSAWLADWIARSERNFHAAGQSPLPDVPELRHIAAEDVRLRLLCMDQISLVELLSPDVNLLGLAVVALDYSWNDRGSRLPANKRLPVRVLHLPALKDLTHADLLAVAFAWKTGENREAAARILRYVASKYPGAAERPEFSEQSVGGRV